MSILSGWIKTRRRKKTANGYKSVSYDTSAETVFLNDDLTLAESEVHLTQAQYDALGNEKNTNGVKYFITDGDAGKILINGKNYSGIGSQNASNIAFNNTSSFVSSTNVQGAIDEIANTFSNHDINTRDNFETIEQNMKDNETVINNLQTASNIFTERIDSLSQSTENHENNIVEIQSYISTHGQEIENIKNSLNVINNDISATKSYFFGGRAYASYHDKYLLIKEFTLPPQFQSYDENNFFVSVTMIDDNLTEAIVTRVAKAPGCFTVYFRSISGAWNAGSVIWFDYSVIINH